MRADAGKLRQVLFNLLGNAVKFTPRGRVDLRVARPGAGRVRFEVADTGRGHRGGGTGGRCSSRSTRRARQRLAAEGTGLGLAISRRLVDLLGGELRVESEPGRGSRFWFEAALPETEDGRCRPEAVVPT